ncbi:hypothetical protein KO527_20195 [Pseudoalteromonas sp. C2R02]|uniref:hypothetical protein n=1 Tax=Pseudoalteromonas sp. C2R02 TaxID=2841565 RepID=UPI001C0903EF|nr:hypothetical protein [Pseudoalteromonas sp. C2R02]MBU2971674.1 hypothetical protein [Pseudoalteromonas sp. C2R02]
MQVKILCLILLLLPITIFASTPNHIMPKMLKCELKIEPQQYEAQAVLLDFTIHNTSAKPISLLTWYTPFEGFFSNLFKITNKENQTLEYLGPMVKRNTPQIDDFVIINANSSLTTQIDLAQAYEFKKDDYAITLITKPIAHKVNNVFNSSICHANTVSINIE